MTTVAFVLWHISFVFLSGDFHFGASDVPLFFVNATLLALIWGLLRLGSGSIIMGGVRIGDAHLHGRPPTSRSGVDD